MLAFFIFLLLSRGTVIEGNAFAYAAVVLGAVFGGLVVFGRPRAVVGERLVHVLVDAATASMLVFGTGGTGSGLFPVFFLAALGVAWTLSPGRMAAGSLALLGGYLVAAVLAAGGFGALESSEVLLQAGTLGAFCGAAWFLGLELMGHRDRGEELERSLTHESGSMDRARELISHFSPVLAVSDISGILRWTASVAGELTGAPYAHVAVLDKYRHHTVVHGDYDSFPSWWHPTVQRLVLWSARGNEVLRRQEEIGGLENFISVPLVSSADEGWGAIIVGGREIGDEEERVLKLLAEQVASAIERNSGEAPGGRDQVSGVPNYTSFRHTLQQEIVYEGSLTVLAVDIRRFRHYNAEHGLKAGDELLGRIGRELGQRQRRVFRLGEDEFVVIIGGSGRKKARRVAQGLRRLVSDLTGGSLQASVGYTLVEDSERDPDLILDAVRGALEEARNSPEGIAEQPVGERMRRVGGARLQDVILSLAEAADVRDSYTGGHMRAVARVAERVGTEMGLPPEEVEVLTVAALLHDVGKIGIPDSILKKPGGLTREEFEVVKTHPEVGVQILQFIRDLNPIIPAVRHHHERYDGLGYPAGLSGEEIPLMARIIFVADSYDAMVRDRVYRRGMPHEQALAIISENSGTQFDPQVVRAFLRVIEEAGEDRRTGSEG